MAAPLLGTCSELPVYCAPMCLCSIATPALHGAAELLPGSRPDTLGEEGSHNRSSSRQEDTSHGEHTCSSGSRAICSSNECHGGSGICVSNILLVPVNLAAASLPGHLLTQAMLLLPARLRWMRLAPSAHTGAWSSTPCSCAQQTRGRPCSTSVLSAGELPQQGQNRRCDKD